MECGVWSVESGVWSYRLSLHADMFHESMTGCAGMGQNNRIVKLKRQMP